MQLSIGDEHSLSNVTGPAMRKGASGGAGGAGAAVSPVTSPAHHLGTPVPPGELLSQAAQMSPDNRSAGSASIGFSPGKSPKRLNAAGEPETDGGQWRVSRGSKSRESARNRVRSDTKALADQVDESRETMLKQQRELDQLRRVAQDVYLETRRATRKLRSKQAKKGHRFGNGPTTRDSRGASVDSDNASQVSGLSGATRYYPQFSQGASDVAPFNDRPASGATAGGGMEKGGGGKQV